MRKYIYSNEFETYEIIRIGKAWMVMQDGVIADRTYKTLKAAKRAIDNQEIFF